MTSFSKETTTADPTSQDSAETPPQEEKKETLPAEPDSRFKASPELWAEAMGVATMLTYCRPHLSKTEQVFINRYLRPIGIKFDKKGNVYKQIGNNPTALWSSHIDTVHAKKGIQKIEYWIDKKSGDTFLGIATKETSSCLGADDTAGVWIMLEMIKAKVPGLYIFHRGEEVGGIGSKWIAEHNKDVVKGIKFAIAFDRKDTGSIITYQRGTRCCSDEFAKSLAEQLGLEHKCDETGSFTDTASYVDLIAECTNLSVGYYNAHGSTEKLNLDYLFKLRDAMIKLDVSKLVEKRKPGENTSRYQTYQYNGGHNGWWRREEQRPDGGYTGRELDNIYGFNKWQKWFEYDHVSTYWTKIKGVTIPKSAISSVNKDLGVTKAWRKTVRYTRSEHTDVIRMVRQNPTIIADMLEELGVESVFIKDRIYVNGGFLEDDYYGQSGYYGI